MIMEGASCNRPEALISSDTREHFCHFILALNCLFVADNKTLIFGDRVCGYIFRKCLQYTKKSMITESLNIPKMKFEDG